MSQYSWAQLLVRDPLQSCSPCAGSASWKLLSDAHTSTIPGGAGGGGGMDHGDSHHSPVYPLSSDTHPQSINLNGPPSQALLQIILCVLTCRLLRKTYMTSFKFLFILSLSVWPLTSIIKNIPRAGEGPYPMTPTLSIILWLVNKRFLRLVKASYT